MTDLIFPTVAIIAAFLAACGLILGAVGSLQLTKKLKLGMMHYFFAALFLSNGLAVILSKRNLTSMGELLDTSQPLTANPISSWLIRLTSLILVIASADQIVKRIGVGKKLDVTRRVLVAGVIAFWCCNILFPAFLSAHTATIQLNWLYTPILCIGLILMTREVGLVSIRYCRNTLIIFCAVSLCLITVRPDLVMQTGYTQGYIPGLPRFAGLAPHAIVMGLVACVGVWCLLCHPLASKFWHFAAMCICLLALFLAQSKAVWISLILTLPILLAYRGSLPSIPTLTSAKYRMFTIIGMVFFIILAFAISVYFLSGSFSSKIDHFLASSDGAKITSFTGRDKIWQVAISEWFKSPVFGYGIFMFGPEHQMEIRMPYATSGHNQIIDALGRTGFVGAASTVVYSLILVYLGLKYARASRGLSAVLSISIIIRMISEIPLTLGNIGVDAIPHYLLLAVLATYIGSDTSVARGNTA